MVLGFEGFVVFGQFAGVFFDFLEDVDLYLTVSNLFLEFFDQFLLLLLMWIIFEREIEGCFLLGLDFWYDVGVDGEEFCGLLARVERVTALGFGKSRNIAFVLIFLKSVLFLLFAFLLLALDLSTQFYLDFLAVSYQVCDFLVLGLEAF